jgi:hypothetical protein
MGAKRAFWPLAVGYTGYQVYDALAGPAVGVGAEEFAKRAQRREMERLLGTGGTQPSDLLDMGVRDAEEAVLLDKVTGMMGAQTYNLRKELVDIMQDEQELQENLRAGAWGAYPPNARDVMRLTGRG